MAFISFLDCKECTRLLKVMTADGKRRHIEERETVSRCRGCVALEDEKKALGKPKKKSSK